MCYNTIILKKMLWFLTYYKTQIEVSKGLHYIINICMYNTSCVLCFRLKLQLEEHTRPDGGMQPF